MRNGFKRILYVSFDRVPQPKGASIHIAQFVRALASRYDVTLLTPGPNSEEGEIYGARHIVVGTNGPNYLAEAEIFRDAVEDHMAREKYDLVHCRGIWEGIPATRKKARDGHLTVYEVNGLPSVELRYHFPAVAGDAGFIEYLRNMEVEVLIEADAVVVPSGVTRNYLVSRGVTPWKIFVIPNGVDARLFTPVSEEPPGPPLVLYVGTLAPWQGVSHLLEAFRAVLKNHEARLRIVSKPRKDWLKALQKQVRKLKLTDAVEFVEPVRHREMPTIMRSAHIGAAPFLATARNTRQGFCPIKVIEYMACGLPVVAPEIEPVKELVRHQCEALLYKPNSMARLRDVLIKLILDSDIRDRLGASGRKRVEEMFTWSKSRQALLGVYCELERKDR